MARNECSDGSITGGTFKEIVINEFASCAVVGVVVEGNVLVRDADQFTMLGSLVKGNLRVINAVSAVLSGNTVNGGNLMA